MGSQLRKGVQPNRRLAKTRFSLEMSSHFSVVSTVQHNIFINNQNKAKELLLW